LASVASCSPASAHLAASPGSLALSASSAARASADALEHAQSCCGGWPSNRWWIGLSPHGRPARFANDSTLGRQFLGARTCPWPLSTVRPTVPPCPFDWV